MTSFLSYAIVTSAVLPVAAFVMESLHNHAEFEKLCEMVAIQEGRLLELRSARDVSEGGLNAYQVELHERLTEGEFESCGVDEIAQLAARLEKRKRRLYGLFVAYGLLVLIPILYLSR